MQTFQSLQPALTDIERCDIGELISAIDLRLQFLELNALYISLKITLHYCSFLRGDWHPSGLTFNFFKSWLFIQCYFHIIFTYLQLLFAENGQFMLRHQRHSTLYIFFVIIETRLLMLTVSLLLFYMFSCIFSQSGQLIYHCTSRVFPLLFSCNRRPYVISYVISNALGWLFLQKYKQLSIFLFYILNDKNCQRQVVQILIASKFMFSFVRRLNNILNFNVRHFLFALWRIEPDCILLIVNIFLKIGQKLRETKECKYLSWSQQQSFCLVYPVIQEIDFLYQRKRTISNFMNEKIVKESCSCPTWSIVQRDVTIDKVYTSIPMIQQVTAHICVCCLWVQYPSKFLYHIPFMKRTQEELQILFLFVGSKILLEQQQRSFLKISFGEQSLNAGGIGIDEPEFNRKRYACVWVETIDGKIVCFRLNGDNPLRTGFVAECIYQIIKGRIELHYTCQICLILFEFSDIVVDF